ncbi:hypothetical protein B0H13DRAFT_1873254 [Mycena leptocephala]|nr:hypothetical protein B0H13DRAFT_1873254 [Mycena leptocephala]
MPAPVKWSLDDQEEFDTIVSQNFRGVLPDSGFALPVGNDFLLAFKRIAAQMPRVNPEGFKDAHTIYEVIAPALKRKSDESRIDFGHLIFFSSSVFQGLKHHHQFLKFLKFLKPSLPFMCAVRAQVKFPQPDLLPGSPRYPQLHL